MCNKNTIDQPTLSILLSSLHNVHDSIRAYDSKAQIVSLGFIFSLGFITTVSALSPGAEKFTIVTVILSWTLGIVPVVMFGYVLFPSRSMAPKLGVKTTNLQRTYYLLEERFQNLDAYVEAIDQSDWKIELIYEIQKSSLLRDMKRKRFVTALSVSGLSFVLMFLTQLLRALHLFP